MKRSVNNIFFFCELGFSGFCAVVFAVLGFGNLASSAVINVLYCGFILAFFGYLFALEFCFTKYDNAVHYKAFAKYYIPTGKHRPQGYKRKGLGRIVLLWIAYLLFLAALRHFNLLPWHIFLIGACIMFALNSFFIRKMCLLSILVMRNGNNCCRSCGINSWDYAIFASALVFAPNISSVATVINWSIIAVSVTLMLIWEINYHKHPYRFYPQTNQSLSCATCLKRCKSLKP